MNTPLITIGITCYNAQDTITDAITSAIQQSWPNTEIIIVDDQSSDLSIEKIKAIEEKHSNIKLIQHLKNKGVAAARNTIINAANGDFIAFFDDDDTSAPERIKIQAQQIIALQQQKPSSPHIICHTARGQHYPDGTLHHEKALGSGAKFVEGHNVATRILTGKPVKNIFGSAPTCSQMACTNTYKMLNGFDETFRRSEDTEFNVRAARAGGIFVAINDCLVSQKMTLTSDKVIADEEHYMLKMIEKHRDFFASDRDYIFTRNWIKAKYQWIAGNKATFLTQLIKLLLKNPLQCLQRLIWALPNMSFNIKFSRFYNEK